MELFKDRPAMAAAALTRLAAADAEAGGRLAGRLQIYLSDLIVRNGPAIMEQLAIELARQHLASLGSLAAATGRPAATYLDDVELAAAMDETLDGGWPGRGGLPPVAGFNDAPGPTERN
jgi:hypothetical protein